MPFTTRGEVNIQDGGQPSQREQGKGKWRSLIGQTQNLRGSDWSNSILDLSFTARVEVNIQDGSQPGQRGHGKGNQGGVSDWSSTKFAGI